MSETISTLRQRLRSGPVASAGAAIPARRQFALQTEGMLTRLLKRPAAWVRRHERFACCIVAVLDIIDKDVPIDGLVTEISQGGLLFRPATRFIFDRRGSAVLVRFGDEELAGSIVNVKATGYGVRFHEEAQPEHIQALLARFGLSGDDAVG
ncbi:MAG: PilZ domain-containing protein [Beijerinckiaceae bacterium]|jgi:hypothetical protein|nr:PilZ domain-containing protein [Beijerinckiaceae bacterium]